MLAFRLAGPAERPHLLGPGGPVVGTAAHVVADVSVHPSPVRPLVTRRHAQCNHGAPFKRAGRQVILRRRIDAVADDVVEPAADGSHIALNPGDLPATVADPDDDRATATVRKRGNRSCDALALGKGLLEFNCLALAAPSNQVESLVEVFGLEDDTLPGDRIRPAIADRAEVETLLAARERHSCIRAVGAVD